MSKLFEMLHGARYCYHDPESDLIFVWYGENSSMIHVYDKTGEIDAWTMGAGLPSTLEQAHDSIIRHIEDMRDD